MGSHVLTKLLGGIKLTTKYSYFILQFSKRTKMMIKQYLGVSERHLQFHALGVGQIFQQNYLRLHFLNKTA